MVTGEPFHIMSNVLVTASQEVMEEPLKLCNAN